MQSVLFRITSPPAAHVVCRTHAEQAVGNASASGFPLSMRNINVTHDPETCPCVVCGYARALERQTHRILTCLGPECAADRASFYGFRDALNSLGLHPAREAALYAFWCLVDPLVRAERGDAASAALLLGASPNAAVRLLLGDITAGAGDLGDLVMVLAVAWDKVTGIPVERGRGVPMFG
jgi:hypothetical protein